jgi:hypothetical protein
VLKITLRQKGPWFIISRKAGTNQMLQYIIPAGKLQGSGSYEVNKYDYRISNPERNTRDIQVETNQRLNGYVIEAHIPLHELEIPCRPNTHLALQLVFNDTESDIRLYELRSAEHPPSGNSILFLGSSSIRLWSTLESDFPDSEVVKCGFGGSRTEDVLYYFDRIVKPYPYQKIVLYCGINDVNASVPFDTILQNINAFADITRAVLPDCQILLLSNSVSVDSVVAFVLLHGMTELKKIAGYGIRI